MSWKNISITLTLLRLISKWQTIWRIITLRPVPIMPLVSHQIHILGPSFRSWSATIYESKFLFSMWVFNSLGSKPPKINSNRCPATRLAANCWIKKKFLSRNKNLRTVRPTTSYMIWIKVNASQIGFYLIFTIFLLVRKEFKKF